jgi:hypothetical protein
MSAVKASLPVISFRGLLCLFSSDLDIVGL